MNVIQLQEYFPEACLTYAYERGGITAEQVPNLYQADYVENPLAGPIEQPNYFIEITQWNHESKQPTYEDLQKYTILQVKQAQASIVNQPQQLSTYSFYKCNNAERDNINCECLSNGDSIYNKSTHTIQVYVNGEWYDLAMNPSQK